MVEEQKRKKRVYVAGPYSKGVRAENTGHAIEVGDIISYHGMIPFIPHLSHFWDLQCPHPYEFWIDQDNEWLKVCDAVYRFSGDSVGADREVKLAESLSIPVFYSLTELVWWSKNGRA